MKETTQAVPSILLVDDTKANLQLLTSMVRQRGYKARPVPSGKLALQAAQKNPPDLILLDIDMPEMDGYQVCEELKADPLLKDIPVIFLSALSETADKVKAFRAGGVDYITKPFQFEEVEARIHTHLELHRQKQQLQENYDRLRKLEILRDKLTHMVVHDMRSPLMALNGLLDLLQSYEAERMTKEAREYLSYCNQATDSLIEMVSSLLDVSKMEAGEMKLILTECDLLEIIQGVITRFESLREKRQITFIKPDSFVKLKADRGLITRVIQNLLSNALKFTQSDGTVQILVSYPEREVRVMFTDNGPGIPAQFHEKIFEKFGQVEQKTNRVGTGLGLAFCRLAIETHGGRIGVESEEGKGSTFWFVLPLNS